MYSEKFSAYSLWKNLYNANVVDIKVHCYWIQLLVYLCNSLQWYFDCQTDSVSDNQVWLLTLMIFTIAYSWTCVIEHLIMRILEYSKFSHHTVYGMHLVVLLLLVVDWTICYIWFVLYFKHESWNWIAL